MSIKKVYHENLYSRCEFKKDGLVCPEKAQVMLYADDFSGYFCEHHADLITKEKESDNG